MCVSGRSKLGNLWIARELQRRFPDLTVTAVHPGVVASDLAGESTGVSGWFKAQMMLDTTAGAQTSLYCALETSLENQSGRYYADCREKNPSEKALREEDQKRLWEMSEELTGLKI